MSRKDYYRKNYKRIKQTLKHQRILKEDYLKVKQSYEENLKAMDVRFEKVWKFIERKIC